MPDKSDYCLKAGHSPHKTTHQNSWSQLHGFQIENKRVHVNSQLPGFTDQHDLLSTIIFYSRLEMNVCMRCMRCMRSQASCGLCLHSSGHIVLFCTNPLLLRFALSCALNCKPRYCLTLVRQVACYVLPCSVDTLSRFGTLQFATSPDDGRNLSRKACECMSTCTNSFFPCCSSLTCGKQRDWERQWVTFWM